VADDELGVALLGPKGATFRGPGVIDGVEGLAADAAGTSLYAVSENSRRLLRLALGRGGEIEDAEDLGTLPKLGGKKKCWEGAAWLRRSMNPEKRDRLLLVNERAPKALALFDPEDLGDHEVLELPPELEDALDDVSDVAVEPETARVWLLSDESSAIGIAERVRANRALTLESRGVVRLPVEGAQSEGIVFQGARRLLLASEKGGTLHTLSVLRR
jgi:uncharacterized protein YjiK